MVSALEELIRAPSGPSLSAYLLEFGTLDQLREFCMHRSADQLQAADATIGDDGQRVAFFFSHRDFPNALFGYRAKAPGEDVHEKLWLAEELATGALHRIMRDTTAAADAAGITWLRLDEQLLRVDS